ncbi:paraquat-inducible protein A [Orbus hercynius]|uniref:Paraquat-inducible protein A n=1 Tax=Orbus hercynius TaxID=593135 RepID=A0A495RIB2_9GAMM|nr:PqiA/YebS family transporter subunit [Orbus hercynius]RKS86926.1 paraquat-inducible protein A [Orbus hercynius]
MPLSNESDKNYVLCHHCDLLSELPVIANKHKAVCPRCHTRLARGHTDMKRDTIIYSLCSLTMLCLACCFIFIDIRVIGIVNNLNLIQLAHILYQDQYLSLTLLFLILVLVIPFLSLLIQLALCSHLPLSKYRQRSLLKLYHQLEPWSMPEIFMAGVLVSFVKLINYGDVGLGKAFILFCLFIVFYLKSYIIFGKRDIWNEIDKSNFANTELVSGTMGIDQNIRLCLCCHAILPADLTRCPRCKSKGQLRESRKIQWTFALLFTSLILYIPANLYGVMNTVFLGSQSSSTILDGVLYMWQEGDYPVALVIFSASVIIPVLKIVALSWLCYFVVAVKHKSDKDCFKMNKIYNMVEFIGRWSMIDVFVVSIVASLIRNGEMMAVYPYIGVIFFASVVIVTMIASHKYDPRLIWDKVN